MFNSRIHWDKWDELGHVGYSSRICWDKLGHVGINWNVFNWDKLECV